MQVLPNLQFSRVKVITVKGHQHGPAAVGASLIHAPTPRGGGDLPQVGHFHLTPDRHLEIINPIEGPRREHTDGGAGRQPLLDGQVGLIVVYHQPPHVVVGHDLVGNPGHVAPEATLLGLFQQGVQLHRNLVWAVTDAVRRGRGQHQRRGVLLNPGIDALVRPTDQGITLLNICVDAPVSTSPV